MWVLEQGDREEVVQVMNRASQGILNTNLGGWKGEHEGDRSEEEEGSTPAEDTDDSTSLATENAKEEVDKSPPPPDASGSFQVQATEVFWCVPDGASVGRPLLGGAVAVNERSRNSFCRCARQRKRGMTSASTGPDEARAGRWRGASGLAL